VDVDLTRASQIGGHAQGDTLTSIEEIDGSVVGHDTLRGNSAANFLFGNGGNDVLEGRGGADTLRGGFGSDTASYESSNAGVTVGLEDTFTGLPSFANGGHATGDVLSEIENLRGSGFGDALMGNPSGNTLDGRGGDDSLFGDAGNDTLLGGDGDDYVKASDDHDLVDGGFGSDELHGEDGTDTVSFQSWDPTGIFLPLPETIHIQLGNGGAQGTATRTVFNLNTLTSTVVETDTLFTFEHVTGSNRAETIVGNNGANQLRGRGGNDVLQGGLGGDTLMGESGTDTASYQDNPGRVIASLANGTASEIMTINGQEMVVSTDSLSGIENLRGSAFFDVLLGNDGDNSIDGRGGFDSMAGGRGDDSYFVDLPGDVVSEAPGEGIDEVFQSFVTYQLTANVENLTLLNGAVAGLGNNLDNRITGNSVGNTLVGGGGVDTIDGGGGGDTLLGGADRDELTGGSGADRFVYQAVTDSGIDLATVDTIHDFSEAAGDQIDVSQMDANAELKGLQEWSFIGTADYTGAGQIRVVFADGNTFLAFSNDSGTDNEAAIRIIGIHGVDAGWFIF
jgi:Ca2+-binding RTX toxin-like protein